jgi:7-cyano-7-deazaguanine synthase
MTGSVGVRAVVLASGGLDSCVASALAVDRHGPGAVALLHVSYGQRTAAREERSMHAIADRLGVARRLVIPLPGLGAMGGSSLTDASRPLPGGVVREGEAIPSTYVPFRNTVLCSLGVAWAEALGARTVMLGAVQSDRAGYPDCRAEYIEALNRLIEAGTRPETGILVEAPLIAMNKAEIVRLGASLGAPFELSWSCYGEEGPACGRCESCRSRLAGFRDAGLDDPVRYLDRDPSGPD